MINIILTPPGIEYVKYLKEIARHYDIFIAEIPNVEGVKRYLSGEIDFDQLLYEIEYFDVGYSRKFYEMLRELINDGIDVIPADPYGLISMNVRVKAILNDLSYDSLSSEEKYIAFIEMKIAEVYRGYNSALLRSSFEDSVRYVLAYARLDAERIKFRSELRAREIMKILNKLGMSRDILIHADHYHEILANYLSRKLACRPGLIRLNDVVSRKLRVEPLTYPGIKLTNNYVYGINMDHDEEYLLASRALIYGIVKARIFQKINRTELGDRTILIDNSLIKFVQRISISDARNIFRKLTAPKNTFKIKI